MQSTTIPPKDPFFQLKTPFKTIATQDELLSLLGVSNHLVGILYQPPEFNPPRAPKQRSTTPIKSKTFENISFAKTAIKNIVFSNCTFIDCLFIGATFENLEFHSCKFIRCNTHKIEIRDTFVHPSSFDDALDHDKHTNIGIHLFQRLMKNFKLNDQPVLEEEATFRFRTWLRYGLNKKMKESLISLFSWNSSNRSPLKTVVLLAKWMLDLGFAWSLGYGLRLRNFVASTVVVFLLIAALNYFYWPDLGVAVLGNKPNEPTFTEAFYFTLLSLSSGLADLIPSTPLGRIVVPIQVAIGVTWVAVLASIIFRKISR